MITRRITAVMAAATVTALALGGCGQAQGEPSEPTEISMLVNITPNLTEEWWNELVAPFEDANPDIEVRIQAPAADGVKATLPQLLASGDVPDIVQTLAPTPELAPELVDLSEYEWATSGPLAEQYSIDGKTYMAGVGIQLQGLFFYNKTAFAEAGITELPTTLDELDSALAALQDAGWVPIQTGGEWMTQLALQAIGVPSVVGEHPDWYEGMRSGDLTFSETYGDTVERYKSWVDAGYIPADQVGVKYADAEQSFLAGNAAIYPMGSWFGASHLNAAEKPEIGVFRAPAASGVDAAQGASIASPYILMNASENQEAAARLVEYLITDEDAVIAQLIADGNFRDGYDYETDSLGEELRAIVAAVSPDSYTPTGDGYGERVVPAGYQGELNTLVQGLLTGSSAADVLQAMDAWFEANR